MPNDQIKLNVKTMRAAGLEARSSKAHGVPVLLVRNPKSDLPHQRRWWFVSDTMFQLMRASGVLEGFDNHTLLADVLSI